MEATSFFELVASDVRRTSAFDGFESVSLHTNKKDQLLAGLFCWCSWAIHIRTIVTER